MKPQALIARTLVSGLLSVRIASDPTVAHTSNFPGLIARAGSTSGTCEIGLTDCGTGCMPSTSVCCGTVGYCDADEYCTAQGCCETGQVCSGLGECTTSQEECGSGCMPKGAVCCPNGGYCDSGEVCSSDGTCQESNGKSGGSVHGSDESGSSGAIGGTCPAGKTICDSEYCIPTDGSTCCNTGSGDYCEAGYYCVTGGCCKNGKVCTGGSGSSIFSHGDDEGGSGLKPTRTSGSTGAGKTAVGQAGKGVGGTISVSWGWTAVVVIAAAAAPLL